MTGFGGEAARKTIHLVLSVAVAALVWTLPRTTAGVLLAGATAVALTIELLRKASPAFAAGFHRRLGAMLRPRETRGLTGATSMAVGYTLAALLLPAPSAVAGILFTGVGDAVAAMIGRRYGRTRYPGGKSVEGSAAFFVVAFGIAWALGAPPASAAAVAGVATVLEALTLPVDDNVYLPTLGGAIFRAVAGV